MVYVDFNATTPVLPEVLDTMHPFFFGQWANPSSPYPFAREAADSIEKARVQVAMLIGAQPEEILFTSCATESNQTVLYGGAGTIATSTVEHSSINEFLKGRDDVLFIPVDSKGLLDLNKLDSVLSEKQVGLVSVIWANNETGVISPIHEIAELCKKHSVLFHSDAVQAAGKINIDVDAMGVDFLSLSAHKIYGPKGIGALYIRDGSPFKPLLVGAQENGRRGGTESVPLIVGFSKAAELATTELVQRASQTAQVRDLLEQNILKNCPDSTVNGSTEHRLPNTTNIHFPGVDSDMLVQLLGKQGVMVSSGSACKSSAITPSHVLQAMGQPYEKAGEAIRFSVSHLTTEQEINGVLEILIPTVASLRSVD